jgi:SAM-dependent methyltransferase
MPGPTWEDLISLNSASDMFTDHIGPVSGYLAQDNGSVTWDRTRLPLEVAVRNDQAPLPSTEAREGYYGADHFAFWASGLRDYCEIAQWCETHGQPLTAALDIGCATGRVLRAFDAQGGVRAFGCDINRRHVDWMAANLPPRITVFQNTSIPALPLPDASVDLVTAFSVFTHVEAFDTTWLAEVRRVLKPGGIAWLTIHGDRVWQEVTPDWPLWHGLAGHPEFRQDRASATLPRPRTVYRWHGDRSYSANVFYRYDYIRAVWGRLMELVEIRPALPRYQDVVILRKAR